MKDPNDYVITRRRKQYKFAWFHNLPNCYEIDDWPFLGTEQSIILEVGAGTGLFAIELARVYPDALVVAVDVKADRLQTGARLANERGIRNVVFLRARADQLPQLFPGVRIAELWLTFSDPFPKNRHEKHRMTHPRFLAIYRDLLGEDGRLCIKTDNHSLFDWSLEQLVQFGARLYLLSYDLHDSLLPDYFKTLTTFEKGFVAKGLPIYAVSASFPRTQVSMSPAPITTMR